MNIKQDISCCLLLGGSYLIYYSFTVVNKSCVMPTEIERFNSAVALPIGLFAILTGIILLSNVLSPTPVEGKHD